MERTSKKLLQGIDTVIIRVSNIAAAKQWYTEKLGLALLFEDEHTKLAVLDTGGPTSITLWQTSESITANKQTASYPIFKTPDAKALKQELSGRGVATGEITSDAYVTYFNFYDPDGNILEACQVHE